MLNFKARMGKKISQVKKKIKKIRSRKKVTNFSRGFSRGFKFSFGLVMFGLLFQKLPEAWAADLRHNLNNVEGPKVEKSSKILSKTSRIIFLKTSYASKYCPDNM